MSSRSVADSTAGRRLLALRPMGIIATRGIRAPRGRSGRAVCVILDKAHESSLATEKYHEHEFFLPPFLVNSQG